MFEEHERFCGQTVIDFANAKTTDEACSKHFENMARVLAFREGVVEKVKGKFPFLTTIQTPNETEAKYLKLVVEERRIKTFLDEQFANISCNLTEYDCQAERVTIQEDTPTGAEWFDGRPEVDFDRTFYSLRMSELKQVYADKLGRELMHATFDKLEKLMTIGKELLSIKKNFAKEKLEELRKLVVRNDKINFLHGEIQTVQNGVKSILNDITQGLAFWDSEEMLGYINRYNDTPQSIVICGGHGAYLLLRPRISEVQYLYLTPSIDRDDYPTAGNRDRWIERLWIKRLQDALVHCLITLFLNPKAKEYLHKCEYCGNYYLAKRRGVSRFCPDDRCHDAWHNRQRTESGRAKEDKRKRYGWKGRNS